METITWGHGEPIEGSPFRTVVGPDQTNGQVVALAVDMPPGLHVEPHTHNDEDQLHVVVSGTLTCRVGESRFRVGAGGTVCLPRGIEHELWNETGEFVRMIDLYTPAGMEERFRQGPPAA